MSYFLIKILTSIDFLLFIVIGIPALVALICLIRYSLKKTK